MKYWSHENFFHSQSHSWFSRGKHGPVLIDNHCTQSLLVLDGAKSLFRLTKLGSFRSAYGVAEWRLAQAQAFKMFLFISRSAEHFLASFLHIVRTNSVRLRPYLLDNFLYSKFKILTYSRIHIGQKIVLELLALHLGYS